MSDQQRVLITARHRRPVPHTVHVVTVKNSISPCPACGNIDIEAWANDGELDSADWWDCKRCGCSGAFLHMDPSKSTTPNGLNVVTTEQPEQPEAYHDGYDS